MRGAYVKTKRSPQSVCDANIYKIYAGPHAFNLHTTVVQTIMRVTHIALVLTLVLLSSQVEAEDDFSFDHAFRRFEKFLERQEAKKVVKEEVKEEVKAERRMGLAHEEDEEEAEGEKTEVFKKHSFLRQNSDLCIVKNAIK